MSYNDFHSRVYRNLLMIKGEFDMDTVYMVAFKESEKDRTKEEIINVALKALDEALNIGMVRYIAKHDGKKENGYAYESVFSQEIAKYEEGLEK